MLVAFKINPYLKDPIKSITMTQKVKRIIFTIVALLLVIILCGLILAHFPVRK